VQVVALLRYQIGSSIDASSWYWSEHPLAGAGKTLFGVEVPLEIPRRRTTIGACLEGVE